MKWEDIGTAFVIHLGYGISADVKFNGTKWLAHVDRGYKPFNTRMEAQLYCEQQLRLIVAELVEAVAGTEAADAFCKAAEAHE